MGCLAISSGLAGEVHVAVNCQRLHARVLNGVVKSQSPLKAVVFKSQQLCPDTVSLDLDPLLHSGVV